MALSVFSTKSAIISLFLPLFAHIGADPPPPMSLILFIFLLYYPNDLVLLLLSNLPKVEKHAIKNILIPSCPS